MKIDDDIERYQHSLGVISHIEENLRILPEIAVSEEQKKEEDARLRECLADRVILMEQDKRRLMESYMITGNRKAGKALGYSVSNMAGDDIRMGRELFHPELRAAYLYHEDRFIREEAGKRLGYSSLRIAFNEFCHSFK